MAFTIKKKEIKTNNWLNEIKRYNLAYTSYKNIKATSKRKPPIIWGISDNYV